MHSWLDLGWVVGTPVLTVLEMLMLVVFAGSGPDDPEQVHWWQRLLDSRVACGVFCVVGTGYVMSEFDFIGPKWIQWAVIVVIPAVTGLVLGWRLRGKIE